MRLRDFYAFNQMLTEKWTLEKCPNMSNLGKSVAGLLYILCILEESENILVATNTSPIGFCGYSLGNKEKKL